MHPHTGKIEESFIKRLFPKMRVGCRETGRDSANSRQPVGTWEPKGVTGGRASWDLEMGKLCEDSCLAFQWRIQQARSGFAGKELGK